MGLSKAFETIYHKLLIAKLHVYGFVKTSLEILWSYLTNCWLRATINTAFSSWTDITKEYLKDQDLVLFFPVYS